MPELVACYFCGAALDAPTDEYRLGRDADAPTVALCDGCREKLDQVLDALDGNGAGKGLGSDADVAADRSGSSETRTAPEPDDSSTAAEPAQRETAGATDIDADAGGADVADPATPANEPETSPEGEASADEATTADDAAAEPRAVVEGDQEISALEYNKVMRLLQNREFPVDREEIVTVAANAYQVSRATCEGVIDAAIDRGLLDEREGELYRTE